MLFFLDHSGLVVFDDSLERRLRSSSKDGLRLLRPTGLSKAWGTGLSDTLYLSL